MKINLLGYLLLSVFFLCSGCASLGIPSKPSTVGKPMETPAAKQERVSERPFFPEREVAKEKISSKEDLKLPAFKKPSIERDLPPLPPIDPKRISLAKGRVTINVEKMPLPDFIIYALGELLRVSFVMDQRVMDSKEVITLRMAEATEPDKTLEILLGLFERYNLHVEEKAGALYILHKSPDPKQPIDIRVGREIPESSATVLQVVPLKYIWMADIDALMRDLYKTGVQIRPYPRENMILLYGQASQMKPIVEFIETFDVPYMYGKKMSMVPLTYWQIDDFVKQLSTILEGLGIAIAKSPREPGVQLIPIKTLGRLLVIATDESALNYVLEWKEKLDAPEAAGAEERPFVYSPKYSKASDLVKSIKNLYEIMPTATAPLPTPTPAAPAGN